MDTLKEVVAKVMESGVLPLLVFLSLLIALVLLLLILRSRALRKREERVVDHPVIWVWVCQSLRKSASGHPATARLETTAFPKKPYGGHVFVSWRSGDETDLVLQVRYHQNQPPDRILIDVSFRSEAEVSYELTLAEMDRFLEDQKEKIWNYRSPQQDDGKSKRL